MNTVKLTLGYIDIEIESSEVSNLLRILQEAKMLKYENGRYIRLEDELKISVEKVSIFDKVKNEDEDQMPF